MGRRSVDYATKEHALTADYKSTNSFWTLGWIGHFWLLTMFFAISLLMVLSVWDESELGISYRMQHR
jgi:hypothetical protein